MSHRALPTAFCGVLLALMTTACARQPEPAAIKEITFQSGEFKLLGELGHNWADVDAFDIPHSWG